MIVTSLISMAAVVLLTPVSNLGLEWQTEYKSARSLGERMQRPLAVVVGSGENGWQKLAGEPALDALTQQALRDKYVCLYVDVSTEGGRKSARELEIPDGPGLILSNRSGSHQAYRHVGVMMQSEFRDSIVRFADASAEVRPTETNERAPAPAAPSQTAPQPVQYAVPQQMQYPAYNSVPLSTCPNCRPR